MGAGRCSVTVYLRAGIAFPKVEANIFTKQHQVLNLALDITCTVRASQSMCLHAGFGFPATLV